MGNNSEPMLLSMDEELESEIIEEDKKLFYCPIEDCPRCNNGYKTANGLKRHMESAHPDYTE